MIFFFFFSSRRRHTRWTGDWSSDVCSSDLDAPVGRDLGDEPEAVRPAKLVDLAERHQVLNDGVLTEQLLERAGIGGVAGLRLLLRRQAELLEQDGPELLRGVDVELLPRVIDDRQPQTIGLGTELGVEPLELGTVDGDAVV